MLSTNSNFDFCFYHQASFVVILEEKLGRAELMSRGHLSIPKFCSISDFEDLFLSHLQYFIHTIEVETFVTIV